MARVHKSHPATDIPVPDVNPVIQSEPEQELVEFVCIRKCYWTLRLWELGQHMRVNEKDIGLVPRHFRRLDGKPHTPIDLGQLDHLNPRNSKHDAIAKMKKRRREELKAEEETEKEEQAEREREGK